MLLVGIRIPPNYGPRYAEEFASMFPELAKQYHVPLVPFLLQNVALDPARMQEDGMHPNAAGEPQVLETVWPYLQPLLKKNRIERGMLMEKIWLQVLSAGGAGRD